MATSNSELENIEPGDDGYISKRRTIEHYTQDWKDIEIVKPGDGQPSVAPPSPSERDEDVG